jgi:superoxide reductase
MTQRMEIYKCQICGNIVEVIHAAGGELVCCGQPMNLLVAGATDAAVEKHVPVVEKVDDHLIEWIELIDGDSIQRAYLSPSSQPEAFFKSDADSASAREYCNLHGLWKG